MGEISKAMVIFTVAYIAYTIAIIGLTKARIEKKTKVIFRENLELRDKIKAAKVYNEREIQILKDQNERLHGVIKALERQIEICSHCEERCEEGCHCDDCDDCEECKEGSEADVHDTCSPCEDEEQENDRNRE